MQGKNNAPIAKWRSGVIEISKWEKNGTVSYTLKKSYKNKKTNEWKKTDTYFDNQLATLRDLLKEVIADERIVPSKETVVSRK